MTQPGDVKDRYLADFEAFVGNGAAGAPAWLKEIREGAIARFGELGFPTMKQEEWRFTSVAPIAETRFTLAHPDDFRVPSPDEIAPLLVGSGPRAVFVDGRYAPRLSSATRLPEGVQVGSLAAALTAGADRELAQQHLARHARWQQSAFAALNTAFLADGAFVYVPAGASPERPLEVLFVATARDGKPPAVSHPRSLVVVERGARATVIESYAALQDGVYWTNAVTEVAVGPGARLEHYRVQRESRQAYHVATTHATQSRDSVLRLHPIALGAGLGRHDIETVLAGAGGDLILNGFYLLRGRQHADHHTVIDHAQPHCGSHEFFNGIVGEQAHGVFNGRIIVRPGAQRTDSKQTNNNLLLSAEARADSQPQLEIYADDVKCTHGSTVGPLDQNALYYLRSRGLSPETAAGMLTYGIAAEILGRMEHPELRDVLDGVVRARLADRARGGRRGTV